MLKLPQVSSIFRNENVLSNFSSPGKCCDREESYCKVSLKIRDISQVGKDILIFEEKYLNLKVQRAEILHLKCHCWYLKGFVSFSLRSSKQTSKLATIPRSGPLRVLLSDLR